MRCSFAPQTSKSVCARVHTQMPGGLWKWRQPAHTKRRAVAYLHLSPAARKQASRCECSSRVGLMSSQGRVWARTSLPGLRLQHCRQHRLPLLLSRRCLLFLLCRLLLRGHLPAVLLLHQLLHPTLPDRLKLCVTLRCETVRVEGGGKDGFEKSRSRGRKIAPVPGNTRIDTTAAKSTK